MEPTFAGELGLFSLFDLGQLLQMNGASGCLTLHADGRRGSLYFEAGRIVNAVDDTRLEGEDAAYRLFEWKHGRFEFRPEAPTGVTLIEIATEALMLEAARRLDEAVGAEARGAADRLLEHQHAFGALRDAFQNLAQEAREHGVAIAGAAATELGALRRVGDVLLLRPGRPPRIRLHGTWRATRDAALDGAEYTTLRARLLGVAPDAETFPAAAEVELSGGRLVHVTRTGSGAAEMLWVRPTALAAPSATHLIAPPDQMALLLGAGRGLMLVASADADVASPVFHALVAARLEQQPETVLLASERRLYRHREGAGVLVEAWPESLGAALETAAPETLALDVIGPPAGSLARRLGSVRLLIARASCEGGPAMLDQWRHSFDAADRASLDAWIQGQNVMLIAAHRPGPEETTLPFSAWTSGSAMPARAAARV